jgi:hypothetical protein
MLVQAVSTRTHGVVDYATAGALLAAPELLRLKDVRSSALAPRIAATATTGMSALTDYELGLVRALPIKAHLALDAAAGALLAASPWILGYRRAGVRYWLPHTVVGLAEVAVALVTRTGDGGLGGRGKGRRAAVAGLAVAAPAIAAAIVIMRRRRSSNGKAAEAEMFSSNAMASAGVPASAA